MTHTSVPHGDRFLVDYADRLTPLQHENSRAFAGAPGDLTAAMLQQILAVQSGPIPQTSFVLEHSPDMPTSYMGSSPVILSFLQTLILLRRPRKVVEIGTFIGLSALSMGQVLPEGASLLTFEKYDTFAALARRNLAVNGAAERVEVVVGDAMETLPARIANETIDLAFIDGDKGRYVDYFELLAPRMADNGLIVVDDAFFHGDALNDEPITDKGAGVKRMLEVAATRDDFHRTLLPLSNGVLLLNRRQIATPKSS